MKRDVAFVEGATALASFLVQTLGDPNVQRAIREWWRVELGAAPPDLSAVFARQDAEIERRIRERLLTLDEPDDLGAGRIGSGE